MTILQYINCQKKNESFNSISSVIRKSHRVNALCLHFPMLFKRKEEKHTKKTLCYRWVFVKQKQNYFIWNDNNNNNKRWREKKKHTANQRTKFCVYSTLFNLFRFKLLVDIVHVCFPLKLSWHFSSFICFFFFVLWMNA